MTRDTRLVVIRVLLGLACYFALIAAEQPVAATAFALGYLVREVIR